MTKTQRTELTKFLKSEFKFQELEIIKLEGYDNLNYRINHGETSYIFKTYLYSVELYDILEAENKVLQYLQKTSIPSFPNAIAFKNGSFIKIITVDGKQTICRMLSFLEGEFLGAKSADENLIISLGGFLAQMDHALKGFSNYTLKARHWEWDLQYFPLNKKYLDTIDNPSDRNIIHYFFQQYEENVVPIASTLRKQIIHNDANEWNILTKNSRVSGIIDFGDITHSYLINELAIAITYVCYQTEDPLKWATLLLKSYHAVLPLELKEISVLYYLIAARLCTSICNASNSRKIDPTNQYATSSEKSAWKMLYKWIKINPKKVENTFREAIGQPIIAGPAVKEAIYQRHLHISPILSLSYDFPIVMNRSAFQYMYDTSGNTFLDAYNNIPHVGHSHPKVVAAGQKQMALLNTNTRYLYDLLSIYAVQLSAKFPPSLNKVFFVNSGSAASDLAIRIATTHTKHKKLMVLEHGYHGNTQIAMDISAYKFDQDKGHGQRAHVLKVAIPDTYNGKYTGNNAGEQYAQEAIIQIKNADMPIASFIAEPIVGCGGQIPLASGYLKTLYPAIRAQGGVCISDEVQTGFGRLGDHFWGFEAQNVVPDMVVLGKPMGNGHPIGAVVTTEEIAASFNKGVEFFSSFGGNPVSCAVGLAVLEVIEEEKLQENAKIVGDYYKSLLKTLQQKYRCIGDVRGSGLF